jgi:HEAT repeat protein
VTVAKAAAIGLGRLGGADAVAALTAARQGSPKELQVEIDNSLLNCADGLAAAGKAAEAAQVYQAFYVSDRPEQSRFAGLRGLVVTRPQEAAKLLADAVRSDDARLSRYAISLVGMAKGGRATEAFVAVLESLPSETKAIMLRALGNRGDNTASKAIIAATKDEDQTVRLAALEALGKVGDASVVSALVEAAATADDGERNVARASLKLLGGSDVDRGLLQLLAGDNAQVRVEAIHALADREASAAVGQLLKAAEDEDASVRREAIRALGALARESDFTAMVKVALAAKDKDDRSAVVDAMGKAFLRVEDKERCAAPVLAELGRAPEGAKPTLVRLLGKTGSAQALRTVRAAVADTDAAMKDAAVHALADWPDESPSDDLLKLIRDGDDTSHKETALQGYLRMAAASANPAEMYLRALRRVETVNDKKAVLEGLGLTSEAPEALDLTMGFLDDEALQASAGVAALRIAFRLRQRDEQRARAALKQVLGKVDHPDVQKRAQEVMNELDKYQDHILQWVGVGPFTERGKDGPAIYATVFEPEKPDARGIEWKPITKGIGSWEINLEATYGSLDFCGAYLRTRVWSEIEQDAQLEMGSDDGVKAWLNGKLVFDQWTESGAAPRQKLVKAKLAKGWNELMLKIVDQQGGWVGAARLRKPDGTALEGLKIQAE